MALYNFSLLPDLGNLVEAMSSFLNVLPLRHAGFRCDEKIKQYMAGIQVHPLYAHNDRLYFIELNNYLCSIFQQLLRLHSVGIDPMNPFLGDHGPVATGTTVGHADVAVSGAAPTLSVNHGLVFVGRNPAVAVPWADQTCFVNRGLVLGGPNNMVRGNLANGVNAMVAPHLNYGLDCNNGGGMPADGRIVGGLFSNNSLAVSNVAILNGNGGPAKNNPTELIGNGGQAGNRGGSLPSSISLQQGGSDVSSFSGVRSRKARTVYKQIPEFEIQDATGLKSAATLFAEKWQCGSPTGGLTVCTALRRRRVDGLLEAFYFCKCRKFQHKHCIIVKLKATIPDQKGNIQQTFKVLGRRDQIQMIKSHFYRVEQPNAGASVLL